MITGRVRPRPALVCDDDPFIVMVATGILADAGLDVMATPGSGAELRAALRDVAPDVLVLDHVLPDASSDELISEIVASAPQCRIILFSAREDGDVVPSPAIFARVPKQGTSQLRAAVARAVEDLEGGTR